METAVRVTGPSWTGTILETSGRVYARWDRAGADASRRYWVVASGLSGAMPLWFLCGGRWSFDLLDPSEGRRAVGPDRRTDVRQVEFHGTNGSGREVDALCDGTSHKFDLRGQYGAALSKEAPCDGVSCLKWPDILPPISGLTTWRFTAE